MNSLKVPESGLVLDGASDGNTTVPPQAFIVSLSDDVVNQMIQGARNGDDLHLSTGKNPALHVGSKSHRISQPVDDAPRDLYLTQPFESTRRAERILTTSTLFKKLNPRPSKKQPVKTVKEAPKSKPATATGKSSASSGLDSDIEALQNGLAAHDAARERAQVVDKVPITKTGPGKSKSKPRPSYNSLATKSTPTTPAANGGQSPVLTASQQVLERKKEQRVGLVHELAAKDRSTDYLRERWTGRDEEFMSMLEKTADQNSDSKLWTIRQSGWKELDVWKYDYASQEDRQMAIDRAIKQYDKQRLSASEIQWQRLLPEEERGKGKCLSRLQANLARGPVGPPPPRIKVEAEESSASRDEGSSSDKAKTNTEKMPRPGSNFFPKPKKPLAKDAPAKRAPSKPKATTQKPSPTKAKAGTGKGSGGRVLSAAIIENSDSSGDEAPIAKPAPKPQAQAPKPKDTVVVNTKPPIRAPMKQQQQPAKRPREEEDSSSSSGTPLSKRIKPKQPLPAPVSKPRLPNANANVGMPRQAGTAGPTKAKNTSPTKSSPLASSPPTNASDLDDETPPATTSKKRKAENDAKSGPAKRRPVDRVPAEVLNKATKFKTYYRKYEALHHEISELDDPPQSKLADLIDMRGRLEMMKREIYKQCSPDRE
ncbi:COM1 regulatory protein [Purpureocillium lilacinum]|uniref:COM1 regulatory protein n=1 Tax=Purpureocillium lilacinum TaxID=33203 RepID=A0A179GZ74_PURLI|nr:COM1 regulatory protein [Purpureocillium lilacinum]OAQ83287.1 COM1 regulatory protein [Purpureocillium lilacinum]